MTSTVRPAFGKGVRLRREPDGSAMLLVPEGALVLNSAAAAALSLIDGTRSIDEIVAVLVTQFAVAPEEARAGVDALFERLSQRRLLVTV
ncbi:MAG TPA: pyrroloquinoline quinone biosynthesis peptide chaperone PqqD [Candidatus Baltobacteraceae bacterium]|nr:pyrroloquinoline quinone biosynthesis peptide chaperone PqqD [Candidatus Baltobacteraceae bacterium]